MNVYRVRLGVVSLPCERVEMHISPRGAEKLAGDDAVIIGQMPRTKLHLLLTLERGIDGDGIVVLRAESRCVVKGMCALISDGVPGEKLTEIAEGVVCLHDSVSVTENTGDTVTVTDMEEPEESVVAQDKRRIAEALRKAGLPQGRIMECGVEEMFAEAAGLVTLRTEQRLQLLRKGVNVDGLNALAEFVEDAVECGPVVCCARCGEVLCTMRDAITVQGRHGSASKANIYGVQFHVSPFRNVENVFLHNEAPDPSNSFFPGYAWTICYCQCSNHIGWKFTPHAPDVEKITFFGLVQSSIVVKEDLRVPSAA